MTERQIQIIVARADLALSTVGRVVIVLYAVILMIAAALLFWGAISAVYRHSARNMKSTAAYCVSERPLMRGRTAARRGASGHAARS